MKEAEAEQAILEVLGRLGELIHVIRRAYEAMHAEYMHCPWCTGHIGYEADYHDDYCIWLKIAPSDWKSEGGEGK